MVGINIASADVEPYHAPTRYLAGNQLGAGGAGSAIRPVALHLDPWLAQHLVSAIDPDGIRSIRWPAHWLGRVINPDAPWKPLCLAGGCDVGSINPGQKQ